MAQPPGLNGVASPQLQIRFDKNKKLKVTNPGPKFLLMERVVDELSGTDKSLQNVSPFLIKKVVDSTCGGTVDLCKKLRNGSILIKTKNIIQASALIKLCSLSQSIIVSVSEHKTLNYVRGVIYSNDLRDLPEEEILSELKSQNVTEIKKILKKVDDRLVETGLIILTFESLVIPNDINIGYEKVSVRPYIPMPLRCNNCFMYGHISKNCNNKKICAVCSGPYHVNPELNESCLLPKCCVNCKVQEGNKSDHAVFDKQCPIFVKEKELQAIMTLEKVNKKAAMATYNTRHQSNSTTFANVIRSNSTVATAPSIPPRKNVSYADVLTPTIDSVSVPPIKSPNVTKPVTAEKSKSKPIILPVRASKRAKRQLKKSGVNGYLTKPGEDSQAMDFTEDGTSDNSSVDMNISTNNT